MADQDDQHPEWPDFLPPDLEQSIPSAPQEQRPQPTPPPQAPPPVTPQPPSGPPRAGRPADPERWFRRPPEPVRQNPYGGGVRPGTPYSRPRSRSLLPGTTTPQVTNVLMGVCVMVWVLQNLSVSFNDMVTLIPALGAAEPWRFITSAFAHTPRSLTHIGFNMLTLWLVGRFLEPMLGKARFLAVYLIAALGGGAAFVLFAFPPGQGPGGYGLGWYTGVLGASGAVFGLFGAYMVIGLATKADLRPLWILLGLNVVLGLVFPGIAWTGHIGGFIAGAAATAVITYDITRRRNRSSIVWPGMAALVALIVLALVVKYAVSL